jgi:hypothetical protein
MAARYAACDDCGRTDPLDAVITQAQWEAITGRTDGGGMLCLWCIDKRAAARGLSFPVRLYFAGDAVWSVSEDSPAAP